MGNSPRASVQVNSAARMSHDASTHTVNPARVRSLMRCRNIAPLIRLFVEEHPSRPPSSYPVWPAQVWLVRTVFVSSGALTGSSVRRAGSNSQRRSGRRPALRREPAIKVTFVVPSWVLRNVRALVASHCGFGPSELGFLRFHVARHSPGCTRWCGRAVALR